MAAANQVKFQGFQFPTIPVLDKVFGVLPPQLSMTRILPLLTIISILTLLTFSSDGVIFSGPTQQVHQTRKRKMNYPETLLGSQITSRKTVSSWKGSHPLSEAWLLEARMVVLSKSQH